MVPFRLTVRVKVGDRDDSRRPARRRVDSRSDRPRSSGRKRQKEHRRSRSQARRRSMKRSRTRSRRRHGRTFKRRSSSSPRRGITLVSRALLHRPPPPPAPGMTPTSLVKIDHIILLITNPIMEVKDVLLPSRPDMAFPKEKATLGVTARRARK